MSSNSNAILVQLIPLLILPIGIICGLIFVGYNMSKTKASDNYPKKVIGTVLLVIGILSAFSLIGWFLIFGVYILQ